MGLPRFTAEARSTKENKSYHTVSDSLSGCDDETDPLQEGYIYTSTVR